MARGTIARGDIWLVDFGPPAKRRPVLVLSRPAAIELLQTVIVAPITKTVHGVPSEVHLGVEHGLKVPSVANLDNVQTIRKDRLVAWAGTIPAQKMKEACRALAAATACGA